METGEYGVVGNLTQPLGLAPLVGQTNQLIACDGNHRAVTWMEVHVHGMVDDLEVLQVRGFGELVRPLLVDVVHQDILVLTDELERAGALDCLRRLLLVVGRLRPLP